MSARNAEGPWVALTVGDPAGIGPEIVALAVEACAGGEARILVLGPTCLRPGHLPLVEEASPGALEDALEGFDAAAWMDTGPSPGECTWTPGSAQASAGRAALLALRRGSELASSGAVAALVTAPVSKRALHLAGEKVEGQTELFERWSGREVLMLGVAGRLRIGLLTRHLPLARALERITADRVHGALLRLGSGLAELGIAAPRLALAGLNPHAGEGGLLGAEETDILEPALHLARADGIEVAGPLSPDAVFVRASAGEFDAVLALYHDQAFIPLKLAAGIRGPGSGEGLTVLLGLPFLRVSPAHGTAYDLAGLGKADPGNLIAAIRQAAAWARARAAGPRAPERRKRRDERLD